jgi:hypothetical protein
VPSGGNPTREREFERDMALSLELGMHGATIQW